jgi:ketosteroid isomerase-like protein
MSDPDQVIEANLKFYFALESLDVDLMEEVWTTDGSASCVHPGWNRLIGWEAIRANWEEIFRDTKSMRIDISEVNVEVHGHIAWVVCLESITTEVDNQTHRAQAYATNVFVYEDARWLLAVHHASLTAEE